MAEDQQIFNLRILSPSPELEAGMSFARLSASTTIKELRVLLRDALPSKPALERMRLIYRGRVVANDADTLLQLFGADNLGENNCQSLHLVLRDLSSGTPTQVPPAGPHTQTNPFRPIPTHPHLQPPTPQPHPPMLPPTFGQQVHQAIPSGQPPSRAMPPLAGATQAHPVMPGQMPFPQPTQTGPSPQGGRTIRQEGIGPNGERWSVTINESNATIPIHPAHIQQTLPPPSQLRPSFGFTYPVNHIPPSDLRARVLSRARENLHGAMLEMDNVRALFQVPVGLTMPLTPQSVASEPPAQRVNRIREHIQIIRQKLDVAERDLDILLVDTPMPQNAHLTSLRRTVDEIKSQAEETSQRLINASSNMDLQQAMSAAGVIPNSNTDLHGHISTMPIAGQANNQTTTIPLTPANFPPEFFLLSSPSGPIGVLFEQRGTFTTAPMGRGPMVQTLPFQRFTNQFVQNRQFIAGIGQQLARGSEQLSTQISNNQSLSAQSAPSASSAPAAPVATVAPPPDNQTRNQPDDQNQNRHPPVHADQHRNARPEQDRMLNIAGHLWLILKLACCVYLFAGSGNLQRTLVLGMVASLVYLAQIGVFEERFNTMRNYFDAHLPGVLTERAARVQNDHATHSNNNGDPNQGRPRTGLMDGLTPEQVAQRLRQQQRFGWIGESIRAVERALAIFVASLWPGIGERMVHAQEARVRQAERARAERVAEEERLRQEQEAGAQKAETLQKKEEEEEERKEEAVSENVDEEPAASAKGKERADANQASAV